MESIRSQYLEGSLVPTRIINFGAKARGDELATGVTMDVIPMDSYDGKEIVEVYAASGFFTSGVMSVRVPGLHRRGIAGISDVYVVISQNMVVPKLIQKLFGGAVDSITISSVAYVDNESATNKARIVQVIEYKSCFMKDVVYLDWDPLVIIKFVSVAVKVTMTNFKPHSEGGKNVEDGRYVYTFDANQGSGSQG
jgi:hypothetical protein